MLPTATMAAMTVMPPMPLRWVGRMEVAGRTVRLRRLRRTGRAGRVGMRATLAIRMATLHRCYPMINPLYRPCRRPMIIPLSMRRITVWERKITKEKKGRKGIKKGKRRPFSAHLLSLHSLILATATTTARRTETVTKPKADILVTRRVIL
jgi:hypothetical protein